MKIMKLVLLTLILILMLNMSFASAAVPGETVTVNIVLSNADAVIFDLGSATGYDSNALSIVSQNPGAGKTFYSSDGYTTYPSGTIGTVTVKINENAKAGSYRINFGISDALTASFGAASLSAYATVNVEKPVCEHAKAEVVGAAKEPTCEETGLTAGKKCAACGEVLEVQEVIPALGHTEVVDAAVAATCIETGLTEGKHCSVCDEVLVAQEVVPTLGHTEVVDAVVAATCTTNGLTEGKHCSVCNEILVKQEVVPMGQHRYIGRKVASTLTKGGYTVWTCANCGGSFTANYTSAYADSMGEIVFNAVDEAMPYTVSEDETACVITAEADADGAYTLRKLVLTEGLIKGLSNLGMTEIHFVVGEYTLVIPMDFAAQEAVAALGAAEKYVFIVDGNAEGGCLVKAEIVAAETAVDATSAIAGLKLRQGENEVEVTEAKTYMDAEILALPETE